MKEANTSTHSAARTATGTRAFSRKKDVYSSLMNREGKEVTAFVTELS